ncbi:transcription factor E2F6 [Acanthopagrus latus]|uniref:transcription factor E2F6 n=1 Tax=Acanthopagrus latus TaxID=8177 RepID=UPI00187CE9FF|nr:transcription factor E2F6 [Acanthopagrus latus]
MVKCVVSGCPNRVVTVNANNRGVHNRPPKRFFNFPTDPARVKVWLAALRETDKQDSSEQHLICEDHFLPEDISKNGVNSDAIPIMPPCLDGPMGMISPWGAESSEEEDQWGGGDAAAAADDDEDDAPANVKPLAPEPPPPTEPPAVDPPRQIPAAEKASEARTTSLNPDQKKEVIQTKRVGHRQDVSLGVLTRRFLDIMLAAPDNSLDIRQVVCDMQCRRRRIYDVTNVLEGISLVERQSANKFKWIGKHQISSFLWNDQEMFEREMESLKLVEETLDTLIKRCAQQLFDMTDDTESAALAYVTYEDIRRLAAFQEQTLFVVKAPEETKLEVPPPKEDGIQVHLKGERGPIMVLTCDIGAGGVSREKSSCFLTLEESRIKTSTLHTDSSSPHSGMQST